MMYVQIPLAIVLSLISIALAGNDHIRLHVHCNWPYSFQEEVVRAVVAARGMEKFGSMAAEILAD